MQYAPSIRCQKNCSHPLFDCIHNGTNEPGPPPPPPPSSFGAFILLSLAAPQIKIPCLLSEERAVCGRWQHTKQTDRFRLQAEQQRVQQRVCEAKDCDVAIESYLESQNEGDNRVVVKELNSLTQTSFV